MKAMILIGLLTLIPLDLFGRGSVIFIHPDGTSLGHWTAARLLVAGPDGEMNWDRMERLAAYRPHQKGWLSTFSHSGATTHAYGKKVHPDSYGMDQEAPLESLSGKPYSLMVEAMKAGIRCGVVNSGDIVEPGTGVFLASSKSRKNKTEIAKKVIMSGADVIFCGGENYLLPKGVTGAHGGRGKRADGMDLLQWAREAGYTVIMTRDELLALPVDTPKVLGIFAAEGTYNIDTEEALASAGLPTYNEAAPTYAEMTRKALEILSNDPDKEFFLVTEEEGTDNFSNKANAHGMLDAMLRADEAIGAALSFMEAHSERNILALVGADSDAGHPAILAPKNLNSETPLPPRTPTGAAVDGRAGTGSRPFLSQPDAAGKRHAFGIAWPYRFDMPGGCVTKAHGYRSELLKSGVDNTDLFRIMHEVLFGPGGF